MTIIHLHHDVFDREADGEDGEEKSIPFALKTLTRCGITLNDYLNLSDHSRTIYPYQVTCTACLLLNFDDQASKCE